MLPLAMMTDATNRLIVQTMLWSLWLPISIEIVFAVGDFSYGVNDHNPLGLLFAMAQLLPLMWLLGVPLTLAVLLLYRRSRELACAVALFSAPLSVVAFFLSVPLPSFLNTLFGAALAWLALSALYLVDLRRWLSRRRTVPTP